MGEAKRRRESMTALEREIEDLTHKLINEGKLIEAGFVGFLLNCYPQRPTSEQHRQLHDAFMAGALHLFSSIMTTLDPGDEPTASDYQKLSKIDSELRAFGEKLALRIDTKGNA